MSNIDFTLNGNNLIIEYENYLGVKKIIMEGGYYSDDNNIFFVKSQTLNKSSDLSLTEIDGLMKYVSRECSRKGYPEIVFL